jgi:hypothetical protein
VRRYSYVYIYIFFHFFRSEYVSLKIEYRLCLVHFVQIVNGRIRADFVLIILYCLCVRKIVQIFVKCFVLTSH